MSTYKVRTIKTTSKATAVQVVEYFNNKRNIVFHLGSASNKEDLELLKDAALKWIDKNDPQASLFPLSKKYDAGSVESKSVVVLDNDVSTLFRTVFNKEKSKLCPISIETIIL